MGKLRQALTAAVGSSVVLVCLLMITIGSATMPETRSDFTSDIRSMALLSVMAGAVSWWMWLRYLKAYIDSAIERKLTEMGKQ